MIKILCDSTTYIPKEIQKKLDIHTIDLLVNFPNESFKESQIQNEVFYQKMREEGIPMSSQPAFGELYQKMESLISGGNDLICVFLSSKMSGTYASAIHARDMLMESYPDSKIEVIDSRSNSMQSGLQVTEIARKSKMETDFDTIVTYAYDLVERTRFLFVPHNLDHLNKGGRIGNAAALFGNVLKLVPILTVVAGETSVYKTVRTKKRALNEILRKVIDDDQIYGVEEIVVHHINAIEEAKEWEQEIRDYFDIPIIITDIGPVIGVHVGPGALGIAYRTKNKIV